MSDWQLVGPKIPHRVWRSHLLIARNRGAKIGWHTLRMRDQVCLRDAGRAGQPTLLVLHGTGLRTRMGTAGFSGADLQALRDQYGERILAFEHRAVRHRIDRNALALVRHLESLNTPLNLHVLGLSRGGLLARMLSEGWVNHRSDIQIKKLVFLGTPNEGSMSARWDRDTPRDMKVWRQDIRRLMLTNPSASDYSVYSRPFDLAGHESSPTKLRPWPWLNGTADQLPRSVWLDRLNGFSGPSPQTVTRDSCLYYALASIFDFNHGAPDMSRPGDQPWQHIVRTVFSATPNDLVVPTAGVYQPKQGLHASGRFPIHKNRLVVLAPKSNATHIGMLRLPQVRAQIIRWLLDSPPGDSVLG